MGHEGMRLNIHRTVAYCYLAALVVMAGGCGRNTVKNVAGRFTVEHVSSSVIDTIGYDKASNRLYVRFNSGWEYVYPGVPRQVYAAFREAPSKGQFFNYVIKDRFPAWRLPPQPVKRQ